MKVGVSGRLLSQFGLKVGLLVLPVLLALCAAFGIVIGAFDLGVASFFVLVALAKLFAVVARSSTFEPSFRVLYQPVASADRLSYQSHVEGTAKQLAVGVVGVALLLFQPRPVVRRAEALLRPRADRRRLGRRESSRRTANTASG